MTNTSLAHHIMIGRLAGRVLTCLHDRFGRAQGLHESDYPFRHADLCHVLDALDALPGNDRMTEDERHDATQEAIDPLLDLATRPGSWPGLDRAVLDALVESLQACGYTAACIGAVRV